MPDYTSTKSTHSNLFFGKLSGLAGFADYRLFTVLVSFPSHHLRLQNGCGKGGLISLGRILALAIPNTSGQSESQGRCKRSFLEYG